jgi:hypothetical protein
MTDDPKGAQKIFLETAKGDFEAAMRTSFWRSLVSWFTKGENELLPFDEVRKHLPMRGQHDIGLKQIPVNQIVGSVGRYNDFDRAFLPLRTATRGRWISVDIAKLKDVSLPPIDVYKIGSAYFVKDGNHRVSVARMKGQFYIDANIVEIDVDIPIDAHTNIDDLIRMQEKIDFFHETRILELRPDAEIELTLPGAYPKLLEHISVHRWFMGEKRGANVPYQEAVAHWYDRVYFPLVKTIRENNILEKFSGRTETDLYLWIIDHLWYLREECEECKPSLEQAAVDFTQRFASHPPGSKSFLENLKQFLINRLPGKKKKT